MLSGKSKRALQKLKIVPGAIVHVYCSYIPKPKPKFVVIVHVDIEDDLILGFFINSEINPFIESNPDLKLCQVDMPVATYKFLDADSYLNCTEVQDQLGCEELAYYLASNPKDHKGMIAEKELVEVLQVVNDARTISDYDKNLILTSLGNAKLTN